MARNRLEISLGQIRQNYKKICEGVAPLEVMSVLKADGYGLGADAIFEVLKNSGCKKFGVADLAEAQQICGVGHQTYILGDIMEEEIPGIIKNDIVAPVTSLATAEHLDREAEVQKKNVKVQFLIDTGMGRLGIPFADAYRVITECKTFKNLEFVGVYSHFPYAYGDHPFSLQQVESFNNLLNQLKSVGVDFREVHIANSDGIHNIDKSICSPFNMVRTGINLYGCFDLEGKKTIDLKQVVTLKSKLLAVRRLEKGMSIGYGRTHTLKEDTLVGTVAIGYADGLPISLSNSGFLLISGVKCPILGRVSMDYTTVDLTGVPEAVCGEDVICLSEDIPVSDWAKSTGTITYDIICSIGNRVKRIYVD